MISRILSHQVFDDKPPVLIDVGASGGIHQGWKKLAPYSICIGFDGDDRKTDFSERDNSGYKKLYVFNQLVAETQKQSNFYLTQSPYCSSRLAPNQKELSQWAFGGLFEVERCIELDCTTINVILEKLGLNYIDWFKTDSQGTDLRIFKSINSTISDKIIIAEFEPGIISAYKGEDLLYEIMEYMSHKDFWMSKMIPKGSQRISLYNMVKYFKSYTTRLHDFRYMLYESASWAEVTYINTFSQANKFDKRDYLLGCAIAIANRQYGYAIDLSEIALKTYNDPIFEDIILYAVSTIKSRIWVMYCKKFFNKLLRLFGDKE